MNNASVPRFVSQLIHKACNEQLVGDDAAVLEQALRTNAAARALFVKVMQLNSDLLFGHQADKALGEQDRVFLSQNQCVSFLEHVREQEMLSDRPLTINKKYSQFARYAAAMLLGGMLVIGFSGLGSEESSRITQAVSGLQDEGAVAVVRGTHDVVWETAEVPHTLPSRSIYVGDQVRLEQGLLQLEYREGVNCLFQGPTVYEVQSAVGGKLFSGKMVTSVSSPEPQLVVKTRTAQVHASAARMAVETNNTGDSVIQVIEGEIDLRINQGRDRSGQVMLKLAEGSKIRLNEDGSYQEFYSRQSGRFVDSLPPKSRAAFQGTDIWLGNLFDDSTTASLSEAISTDKYGAAAETIDLGVASVLDGGLDVDVELAPGGLMFNFSNLGGHGEPTRGLPGNDVPRSTILEPIRTLHEPFSENEIGKKIEEGIGMHANELLTFNLEEIRKAGALGNRRMRFVADRIGLNDSVFPRKGDYPREIRTFTIFSNHYGILVGYVNGQKVPVSVNSGVYSFHTHINGTPVDKLYDDGHYASLDVQVPANAMFLTLATVSCGPASNDHAVFSGARLVLEEEQKLVDPGLALASGSWLPPPF